MNNKISEINRKIGIIIRITRLDKKISQEKLAEFADVNRNTIGTIERGEISPTIETLYKIATALNIELHDLVDITKINIQICKKKSRGLTRQFS